MNDDINQLALNGLFEWVIDYDDKLSFPQFPVKDVSTINDDIGEYNTRISVKMREDYIEQFGALSSLDKTFDLVKGMNRIDTFCILLRTKTAVGNTKYLFNKEPIVPIDIELKVYDKNGVSEERRIPYKYYHPKDFIDISDLSYEFNQYVLEEKHKAGFESKFKALSFTKENEIIGQRPPFIDVDIHLCAISSTNLSTINDELGLFGELSDAGFSYGVYLSIDGMPTGIRIDDWDTKGASNKRYFSIVDANLNISDELDSGRKGISYTRAKQLSDKVLSLRYEQVKDMSDQCVGDTFIKYANKELLPGNPSIIDQIGCEDDNEYDIDDFKSRVNESKQNTLDDRESNKDKLEYLQNNFSLQRFPRNEEEVRSLFHEMVAKNILKGYKTIYDASSRAEYDTALDYHLELIEDNLYPLDKLGISESNASSLKRRNIGYLSHENLYKQLKLNEFAICTEFKYSLNSFMYDISRASTSKSINKLDLVIVWDNKISSTYSEQYTISPEHPNTRLLHGCTHRLNIIEPEVSNIYCISLSDVIDKIMEKTKNNI